MNPSRQTELRKTEIDKIQQLVQLLDSDESILSLLMGSVATDLDNPSSALRFTSQDVETVRNHADRIRKSATMIFLDEWSTMGRSRPNLGHLLGIFVKCQLFRAADYLANLIGEPIPERPITGPAARVDIGLDIDEIVNGLNYPFSGSDVNKNKPRVKPEVAPRKMNSAAGSTRDENISIPLIPVPSKSNTKSTILAGPSAKSGSDLIKFSSASTNPAPVEDLIPIISGIHVSEQNQQIPMTVNSGQIELPQDNRPAISGLLQTNSSELPAVLASMGNSQNIQIGSVSTNSVSGIPAIDELINGASTSRTRSQIDSTQSMSSSDSD